MRLPGVFRKRRPAKVSKCQRHLALEPLEQRRVMSVSLQLSGSVLNITGDARNDTVELVEMRSNPASPVADLLLVAWKDDLGKSGSGLYVAPALTKIVFQGNGGNDVLKNVWNPLGSPTFYQPIYTPAIPFSYSMLPVIEAHGGAGSDTIYGGPKQDWLYGDDGNDTLYGNYGNDVLDGGRDNDVLYGGPGHDTLYGRDGHDLLYGGDGHDTLYGNYGNDLLDGGRDNDTLYGGVGDDRYVFDNKSVGGGYLGYDTVIEWNSFGTDTLDFFSHMNRAVKVDLGTTALQVVNEFLILQLFDFAPAIENVQGTYYNDVIRGNALNNYIYGSDGNDTLYGMAGNDTLDGGCHNDRLVGGPGADYLIGGDGNDSMFGGCDGDVDTLVGGPGNDRFLTKTTVMKTWITNDIVSDATANDAICRFDDRTSKWTDAEVENVDRALEQLQNKVGGKTWVLKDPICKDPVTKGPLPVNFCKETATVMGALAGENVWGDWGRKISIVDWNESDANANAKFRGVVIHEMGHNWHHNMGNPYWDAFVKLNKASSQNADYAYSYGKTDVVEDWATCWEAHFGYQTPTNPSNLFKQKLAVLDSFFSQNKP